MRARLDKRALIGLAGVSAVSLVALAFLQYRWITQLDEAERERMHGVLERDTRNFRDEFNGEIEALLTRTMQGPDRDAAGFAERFRLAAASIPHPGIVSALYLAEPGSGKLERASVDGARTESPWPGYLGNLGEAMLHPDASGSGVQPFWNDDPPAIGLPMAPPRQFRPEPAPPPPPPAGAESPSEGPPPPPGPSRRSGWVVVEFNMAYLREELVPELVRRHFGAESQWELLAAGEPPKRILGTPVETPDATVDFFEFHVSQLDRSGPGRGPRDDRKRAEGKRLGKGLGKGMDKGMGKRGRRPREAGALPAPGLEPERPRFESPRWTLRVKLQSGSLDAQVDAIRARNLGVSAVVLLMLAASTFALIAALRRADELARMQLDFVAGVSHELRTPLAVIRSAGENMADGVVTSEKQVRNYGALVRDEGRRLSRMVEQILRFARLETGTGAPELTRQEPARLATLAVEQAKAEMAGVEFAVSIEDNLPEVMADEAAMTHCLQNLLTNAVKYGDGKWVGLEIRWADGGAGVEFAVTDRGPGIAPGEASKLFDPFFRGQDARENQTKGLGIGLSLVKRVVDAHGGQVKAANAPEGGARFSILLPAAGSNPA